MPGDARSSLALRMAIQLSCLRVCSGVETGNVDFVKGTTFRSV
jgi:hypothetical protein